jgi:hypothetical protein
VLTGRKVLAALLDLHVEALDDKTVCFFGGDGLRVVVFDARRATGTGRRTRCRFRRDTARAGRRHLHATERIPHVAIVMLVKRICAGRFASVETTPFSRCSRAQRARAPRLKRRVPANSAASCATMVKRLRKSSSRSVLMFNPSMVMLPLEGSMKRKKLNASELLPLPVRPTMPTFSPPLTLNETPFNTGSSSGA